ncbi:MAG: hypothetical protein Q9224_005836 [Gallowayella concinna]
MEGFRQYSLLAKEDTKHSIGNPWFAHVCEGLRKLSSIQTVDIRNTWDMVFDDDIQWDSIDERSDTNEEVRDGHQSDGNDLKNQKRLPGWTNVKDGWLDCSSNYASMIGRPKAGATGLRIDGTRSVGSPLARTWPPERLQPPTTMEHWHDRENVCSARRDEWYNVNQGFILVTQMLKSVDKQPLSFRIPGNNDLSERLSPSVLTVDRFPNNPFLHLATHLKTLKLSIASLDYGTTGTTIRLAPNLWLLIEFLKRAKSLDSLDLGLPVESRKRSDPGSNPDDEEGSAFQVYLPYKFASVFPPLSQLQLNDLTELVLFGLEITYRDLAGLLFLKLPNLKCLSISYIHLVKGGDWEDIVEGLCRISHLEWCALGSPLLYSNFQTYSGRPTHSNDDYFMHLNSNYVSPMEYEAAARHPALKSHELDSASGKYLQRLNETLDEVRKSMGT